MGAEQAEALPEILTAGELEKFLRIDRKTIYSYVQRGLIPHMRIESNVRFSKHQVQRPVNGEGARRPAPKKICGGQDPVGSRRE